MCDCWWSTVSDVTQKKASIDLAQIMHYAQEHYARHTEWYLRHRDTGIKTLGVLLTADFTITGLYYAEKVPRLLSLICLIVVAFLSIIIAYLSLMNCRQAYKASLEHAMLVSKTAWQWDGVHQLFWKVLIQKTILHPL